MKLRLWTIAACFMLMFAAPTMNITQGGPPLIEDLLSGDFDPVFRHGDGGGP